jgi:large subunit ribosomal protein L6
MSRVGNRPIELPQGVEVKTEKRQVEVKGPKGTLTHQLPHEISLEQRDNLLMVVRQSTSRRAAELHGLTRTLLSNMVVGVSQGFERKLEINGIGYRAMMQGNTLVLNLGYSHPINYQPAEGLTIEVSGRNEIVVKGIDKQKVGQAAAEIRSFRKPEPYKGKGILYAGERVRRKAGKATA